MFHIFFFSGGGYSFSFVLVMELYVNVFIDFGVMIIFMHYIFSSEIRISEFMYIKQKRSILTNCLEFFLPFFSSSR